MVTPAPFPFILILQLYFSWSGRGLPIYDQLAVVTYQAVNVRKHKQSYSSHEGGNPHRLERKKQCFRITFVIDTRWCWPGTGPRWASAPRRRRRSRRRRERCWTSRSWRGRLSTRGRRRQGQTCRRCRRVLLSSSCWTGSTSDPTYP